MIRWNNWLTVFAITLAGGTWQQAKDPVNLVSMKPITGYVNASDEPLAIGGVVFDTGVYGSGTAVYDLKKKFSSFVFAVSTKDNENTDPECRFTIRLDGNLVADETIEKGSRPVRRVIDVQGKRSLRIALASGVAFGEPTLHYEVVPQPKSSAKGGEKGQSSDTTALVDGETLKLRWPKVAGAVCYGVTITLASGAPSGSNTRLWSFTTKNRLPELDVPTKDLTVGKYTWQIVAFDEKSILPTSFDGVGFQMP